VAKTILMPYRVNSYRWIRN